MIKKELRAERDVLPDLLKGFGIILMVLGHCIQESYNGADLGGNAFFEDRLYQFIYSFHMPLFMIISGYYAWNSIHRAVTPQDRKKMILKKCVYLITPNVVWKLFDFVCWYITGEYIYRGIGILTRDIVISILTNFWFLWAVLYSFILVCFMHYKCKDAVWLYVLVFIAMFFTPDGMGLMAYKYVLPYYLMGFYANKNKDLLVKIAFVPGDTRRRVYFAFLASGLIFFGLFSFYNVESFVYLTGYKLIGKDYRTQLQIDLYRFLVGFCGIVFWSLFWRILLNLRRQWKYGIKLLAYIGSKGRGIYIVSGYPMQFLFFHLAENGKPNYIVNLAQTMFILFWAVIIVEVLGRIKGARMLVGQ